MYHSCDSLPSEVIREINSEEFKNYLKELEKKMIKEFNLTNTQ